MSDDGCLSLIRMLWESIAERLEPERLRELAQRPDIVGETCRDELAKRAEAKT